MVKRGVERLELKWMEKKMHRPGERKEEAESDRRRGMERTRRRAERWEDVNDRANAFWHVMRVKICNACQFVSQSVFHDRVLSCASGILYVRAIRTIGDTRSSHSQPWPVASPQSVSIFGNAYHETSHHMRRGLE
eukprot:4205117-Pleurochrysis_carterae.AAC.1